MARHRGRRKTYQMAPVMVEQHVGLWYEAAAKRLDISNSALTRIALQFYMDKHTRYEPNREDDRSDLIDLDRMDPYDFLNTHPRCVVLSFKALGIDDPKGEDNDDAS